MADDKLTPPEPDGYDTAHDAAGMVLGTVPLFGSIAAKLFDSVVTPSLDRRRQKWMQEIVEAIRQLEREKVSIDDLKDNEEFVDILLHASQAAMRTHRQEKLDALRNAVVNSALPNSLDEMLKHMFITWIDELSAWHVLTLRMLQNPGSSAMRNGPYTKETIAANLERAYSEFHTQPALRDMIVSDLETRSLVVPFEPNNGPNSSIRTRKRITAIGEQFLAFIAEPANTD